MFVQKLEFASALILASALVLALTLALALALALALEFGVLHPHLLWQTHVVYRHEFDRGGGGVLENISICVYFSIWVLLVSL